ncbi:MAG: O-antigen ligase family protein [Armatimonadota bacterium]|nr:O-antigen ligase family protein [Armatimonadota bacterium]
MSTSDAVAFLAAPALLSLGTVVSYVVNAGKVPLEAAWRPALLPLAVPVLTLALTHTPRALVWNGLTGTLLALLAYGIVGFYTGVIGEPDQHALGYFGIRYTASTRNADALYFLLLFFHLIFFAKTVAARAVWIWTILTGMTTAAIVLSQSRATWLSLLVGLAVVLAGLARDRLLHRGDVLRLFAIGCTAILAILLADITVTSPTLPFDQPATIKERLYKRMTVMRLENREENVPDRIKLLELATRQIATHPLTGIGPGRVPAVVQDINLRAKTANHVENSFLQAWLDAGLLGFVGFTTLWGWLLLRHLAADTPAKERIRDLCIKGLAAAFVIWATFNVLFDNLTFWVFLGLAAGCQVHRPRWSASA